MSSSFIKFFTGSHLPQDKIITPQALHDLAPVYWSPSLVCPRLPSRGHVSQAPWLYLVCITLAITPADSFSLNLNTTSGGDNTWRVL